MAGIFSKDPHMPEGKFPIVLRRDGTPVESPYFVILLKDPCAGDALHAYANHAQRLGLDKHFVLGVRELAHEAEACPQEIRDTSDPDAPRHRTDDPVILAWARSINNPSA